jgi:hypothetical protein
LYDNSTTPKLIDLGVTASGGADFEQPDISETASIATPIAKARESF